MIPPPITRDGAQHDARQELAKAIYHRNSEPLPVRLVKWFGHLVDRFFNATLKHAPAGNVGAFVLVLVVLVVVVVVVWRVGIPRHAAAAGAVLPADRTQSAADHRRLALAAADRQDWHTAVIEQMRAIARELEERGVLEPRAGRTATELSRDAAAVLPAAAHALVSAAATFNHVAYGGGTATAGDVTPMARADDEVRRAARHPVAVG